MSEKTFKCCECCAAGVDADTHVWAGKDWHEVDCDSCNGYRFSHEEYLHLIATVERAAAEKAILKLSGTKQAEVFQSAVDIRPGRRKPLHVSVRRWLREEAAAYRREETE